MQLLACRSEVVVSDVYGGDVTVVILFSPLPIGEEVRTSTEVTRASSAVHHASRLGLVRYFTRPIDKVLEFIKRHQAHARLSCPAELGTSLVYEDLLLSSSSTRAACSSLTAFPDASSKLSLNRVCPYRGVDSSCPFEDLRPGFVDCDFSICIVLPDLIDCLYVVLVGLELVGEQATYGLPRYALYLTGQ